MQAIHSVKTNIEGNKITITGELCDVNFPLVVGQRHTIMHPVNGNMNKPRHIEINSHGVLIKRNGVEGVLFPKDELVAVMIEIDSKLTDPPIFIKHPDKDNLVGEVKSELPVTAKIQHSDDGEKWMDTDHKPDFKGECGKHYRCVASNKNGESVSKSFHIPPIAEK